MLLCLSMTSKVDVGGMEVETEPSQQYSIACCCCAADAAVWQNGVWYESAYEAKVCHWIPPYEKENGIHWYLSTLAEHLWRQNRGCEHS